MSWAVNANGKPCPGLQGRAGNSVQSGADSGAILWVFERGCQFFFLLKRILLQQLDFERVGQGIVQRVGQPEVWRVGQGFV